VDVLTDIFDICDTSQLEDILVRDDWIEQLGVINTTDQQLDVELFTHGVDESSGGDVTDRNTVHVTQYDNA
jgi:hypothetical protein